MPLATFKDHATLQNPWSACGNHNLSSPLPKSLQAVHQENTSDTLEETDEITSDTSEEAQILADLLEANGVNKLFDKLEAPFALSSLILGTSSNEASPSIFTENTTDTLEETDEITSNTSEEAQILADLLETNGVNKLFGKLEAPFAPSSFLLRTSSNEAATHIQKGLIISLQSMTDVNGMIAVANNVFMILKSLGIDFISFYENVKIFLGCFALKTQLADSSNLSTAEFEAQYYEKKLHFDKVSGEHEQLSASIIKSDEHIAGLNQRIIQTKELLKQAEHASFMCDFA
ncbi:uncharacterized protein LOC114309003 [Camellia sinensis]|uniref:uncharacterized protein LOC114309003 n=1 Tax=Camellia sinensis TaxID=4442 RepID=UPI001036D472|nr:uncharacterized protein LOC114309003 [Camellia sinensis]